MIPTSATEPTLPTGAPNIFVMQLKHTGLADAAVWYFRHVKNYTRAAVLADQTSPTLGNVFTNAFITGWKAAGGTITTVEYTQGGSQTDFSSQLLKILGSNLQFVASAELLRGKRKRDKAGTPARTQRHLSQRPAELAGGRHRWRRYKWQFEITGQNPASLVAKKVPSAIGLSNYYKRIVGSDAVDLNGTLTNGFTVPYALMHAFQIAGSVTDTTKVARALHKVRVKDLPALARAKWIPIGKAGTLIGPDNYASEQLWISEWRNRQLVPTRLFKG